MLLLLHKRSLVSLTHQLLYSLLSGIRNGALFTMCWAKESTSSQKGYALNSLLSTICCSLVHALITELIDKVLIEYSRAFPVVFEKANEQLREVWSCTNGWWTNQLVWLSTHLYLQVFGMEAREILKGKTKFYILVNCLSSSKRDALVEWWVDLSYSGWFSLASFTGWFVDKPVNKARC